MSSVFRNQGRSPGNEIEKRKVMIFAFLDKGGGTRSCCGSGGQWLLSRKFRVLGQKTGNSFHLQRAIANLRQLNAIAQSKFW